jgi:hypothetical protein
MEAKNTATAEKTDIHISGSGWRRERRRGEAIDELLGIVGSRGIGDKLGRMRMRRIKGRRRRNATETGRSRWKEGGGGRLLGHLRMDGMLKMFNDKIVDKLNKNMSEN